MAAYEAITVKDGGTVTGVVRFVGTPPTLSPIPVNKNRDVAGTRSRPRRSWSARTGACGTPW